MGEYIYGIDFGTTNSAISIIDTSTNQIVKTFNESSIIFFPQLCVNRVSTVLFFNYMSHNVRNCLGTK